MGLETEKLYWSIDTLGELCCRIIRID